MKIDKKIFLQWLSDEGAFKREENVIYAEKAFIAHSVVRWCVEQGKKRKIHSHETDHVLKKLRFFLKGKVDLFWEDDIIKIRTIKKKLPKKEKKGE